MEGNQTDNDTRVPPPDMDGENLVTPVTSRQLLQLLADFEERMTKKISCEMNRLVFQKRSLSG